MESGASSDTAKHVSQIVMPALNRILEPKIKEQVDLEKWAEFFRFNLRKGTADQRQMEQMVLDCALFCKRMKAGARPYWLSLLGTSGAGKTFIAKRIFRWHRDCGRFNDCTDDNAGRPEVVYAREWCWWPEMAALLKGNEGYGWLRDVESCNFAVIDEIGSDLDKSGHVSNCLANALCSRVGKWTLITSNKTLGAIQRELDTRVASRMIRDGSVVVDLDVLDYGLFSIG